MIYLAAVEEIAVVVVEEGDHNVHLMGFYKID
ncbi:Uncharacterised protein [uncultured archaeon]|nr:Uncharacterised protein [uncultured archaeon]